MNTTIKEPTAPATDEEIVSMRVIPAPREKVFRAFSDPTVLAQWWGPKDFTNRIETFELKPEGRWLLTMCAPNGAEYHNESRFVEVTEPAQIVFEHLGPVHWYHMVMSYDEEAGGTRLTWRMRFASVEEANKLKQFIAIANEQNFDRLETCLTAMV